MAELRSFIFLSRLQPQTMCYLGTWIRGSLPRSHVAAQVIEVAPGLDIEPLTDVAVKHADVKAGILVVERQFGYLEIHGGTDEVQAAASAVLGALGATARDASRPEILASKIITMLDPQQAFLVNRNKIGSMALAGESLCVLEMRPASYAILAANEAEKAARIKLVDYRMIGATGRLYLSGSEADVRQPAGSIGPGRCRSERCRFNQWGRTGRAIRAGTAHRARRGDRGRDRSGGPGRGAARARTRCGAHPAGQGSRPGERRVDREGALMLTATVIGSVWASRRLAELPNGAFLEVEAEGTGQRM